ncbi:MAG: hypothetical protein IPP47_28150 [Bryobacterales bacterium]|nr:hypothetical protein [Bryobacterales bacterium]
MKAPVWFLIGRIAIFGSSSANHRAYLVDGFIRHFGDWWLIGSTENSSWGWSMWDTANQFVEEGLRGGLGALGALILLISISFGALGRSRARVSPDWDREWLFWLLGATLFAHIVGFFGISYHDQTRMAWFMVLAMIVSSTYPRLSTPNPSTAKRKHTSSVTQWAVPGSVKCDATSPFSKCWYVGRQNGN